MNNCAHTAAEVDAKRAYVCCLDCGNRIPTPLTPRDLAALELALTGRRTA